MNQNHNKNNTRFINRDTFRTKCRRLKTKQLIFLFGFSRAISDFERRITTESLNGSLNCNWLEADFGFLT